jgi:hypothetical protein
MTNHYSFGCKCGASTTSETWQGVNAWATDHYVVEHLTSPLTNEPDKDVL